MGAPTEGKPVEEIDKAIGQQQALTAALRESYEDSLVDEMGKLYNHFVGFISSARLPLPQVLLVLEMLKQDTIEQAVQRYKGE